MKDRIVVHNKTVPTTHISYEDLTDFLEKVKEFALSNHTEVDLSDTSTFFNCVTASYPLIVKMKRLVSTIEETTDGLNRIQEDAITELKVILENIYINHIQ